MGAADRYDSASGRSVPDLTALLLDLLRVVKGRGFYGAGDPRLAQLFERTLRAWQSDLARHGTLELRVTDAGLRVPPNPEPLASERLRELAQLLRERRVRRLHVEKGVDADAFAGLIHVLTVDTEALRSEGGPSAALAGLVPSGIRLEEEPPDEVAADTQPELVDLAPLPPQPVEPISFEPDVPDEVASAEPDAVEPTPGEPATDDRVEPAAPVQLALVPDAASDDDAFEDDGSEDDLLDIEPIPHGAGAPALELAGATEDELEIAEPADGDEFEPQEPAEDELELASTPAVDLHADRSDADTPASQAAAGFDETDEATLPEVSEAPAPQDEVMAPPAHTIPLAGPGSEDLGQGTNLAVEPEFVDESDDETPDLEALEQAPLERGVRDEVSAELVDVLRELDGCESVSAYADLARRSVHLAQQADERGREDDAYRVVLVLSDHAAQATKRPERQAELAQDFLRTLVSRNRMSKLIVRACAPGNETGVRATQVLLQLGTDAVAALLQAAENETDATRRAQMYGILIALGEHALPELLRALDDEDPERIVTAVRLVGDIQSPEAVPRLGVLLGSANSEVREESAKSLVRIGDERAVETLIRALRSRTPGMAALAVYCLAATGSSRAVHPLVATLDEAVTNGRTDVAREVVRALGRLGRAEGTPPLASILLRKKLFGGRKLRELKVAAATALGTLPGDEAVGALAQALQARDTQVRKAAQMALDRRARALQKREG